MEWADTLQKSIVYIEGHLREEINIDELAREVAISPFYLQKGFRVMTGYSVGEYIRCRRLYLSALELSTTSAKVIDLAYQYGYETPESFTKAFTRFHGVSPSQVRQNTAAIKTFLPLKIKIVIQGGNDMDYQIEKKSGFKVIGFRRQFSMENSYAEIPKFWGEIAEKHFGPLQQNGKPMTEVEKAVEENNIGEFGVCIDNEGGQGMFSYMIAGEYKGGDIPEGMVIYEFPDLEWAEFRCVGRMPAALQSVNTKIFQEWLPGNKEFDIAMGANIEWYSMDDMDSPDYESAIWVPVKRKA